MENPTTFVQIESVFLLSEKVHILTASAIRILILLAECFLFVLISVKYLIHLYIMKELNVKSKRTRGFLEG